MAGSAADTPTTPEFIRVSDVDRDRAVDELRKEFVDGRLSQDTFLLRMHAALGARNHGDLSGLFYDLPARVGRLTRLRQAVRRWRGEPPEDYPGPEAGPDNMPEIRPREAPRGRASWYEASQHEAFARAEPLPGPAARAEVPPKPLVFPPGADVSFTIGRDQRCDLYISDMTVSRLHARLDRGPDGWVLSDLGSSNGTRVNGWRLRAAVPVQAGDTVTFGSAVFIIQPGQPGDGSGRAGEDGHWQPAVDGPGRAGVDGPGRAAEDGPWPPEEGGGGHLEG
jgi:hypothetical protein